MYRHHEDYGWGGCWGHPRWGWGGGPFIERRVGYPLLGGMGMGGGLMGGGLMGGGGLVGDLLAGGVGYLVGKNSAQNQPQYQQYPPNQPQYQQYPPNQPQYQQAAPQYQQPVPQYQPAQGSTNSPQDSQLAQLNLLGRLRTQGVLTDAEFQAEKQKILNGG